MYSWNYGPCELCSGKTGNQKCPICKGYGFWEFVDEDNAAAVRFLNDPTAEASDYAKFICGERIHSLPPDHCEAMLRILDISIEDFDELHLAGATRWGWAWVHANRFAIACCKLNGSDPTAHAYGLTKLAWFWLDRELQKKIDAPIDMELA